MVHGRYWWNFRRNLEREGLGTSLKKIWETGNTDQARERQTEARTYWRERDHCEWTDKQEDQTQTHRSARQISREARLTQSSMRCWSGLKCEVSFSFFLKRLFPIIVSFSDIYSSQATQLRWYGIFSDSLLHIFQRVCQWKHFKNRSIFGEDMTKSCWHVFYGRRCSLALACGGSASPDSPLGIPQVPRLCPFNIYTMATPPFVSHDRLRRCIKCVAIFSRAN